MTHQEARTAASNNFNFSQMVENSTLTKTQVNWLVSLYQKLELHLDALKGMEVMISVDSLSGRRAFATKADLAKPDIEKADEAYVRVFNLRHDPRYEDSIQNCDGEITFAASEALRRLRALVLRHQR